MAIVRIKNSASQSEFHINIVRDYRSMTNHERAQAIYEANMRAKNENRAFDVYRDIPGFPRGALETLKNTHVIINGQQYPVLEISVELVSKPGSEILINPHADQEKPIYGFRGEKTRAFHFVPWGKGYGHYSIMWWIVPARCEEAFYSAVFQ
jgi:hypothetical protein